jgi:hypothetical protein
MLSILSYIDKTMLCPTFSSSAPHPKKMTGLTNNHSLNAFTTRFAFPFKVHAMLDAAERAGMESIVSWQPHGNTFRIHKPKKFAEIIVSRYFNQTIQILSAAAAHLRLPTSHRQKLARFWCLPPRALSKRPEPIVSSNGTLENKRHLQQYKI